MSTESQETRTVLRSSVRRNIKAVKGFVKDIVVVSFDIVNKGGIQGRLKEHFFFLRISVTTL